MKLRVPNRQSRNGGRFAIWEGYLPALLFVGFFFPNTRIYALGSPMYSGRWGVLLLFVVLALVAAARGGRISRPHGTGLALLFCLGIFAALLPFSANFVVAAVKLGVFTAFALTCLILFGKIQSREDAIRFVIPLVWGAGLFTWSCLMPGMLYAQYGYGFRAYLKNPNALGMYLAIFGLPAMIYALRASGRPLLQRFGLVTLPLQVALIIFSGSRTAMVILLVVLGTAFWRYRGLQGRHITAAKVLILFLAFLLLPFQQERIVALAYKYPTASSLFDSRAEFWQSTNEAIRENPWFGAGFGIQVKEAGSKLGFTTNYKLRRGEQGSTYLGLLEEVGLIGGPPFFLLLFWLTARHATVMFFSRDPLRLFFSRVLIGGILWGVTENYMLYLGNAASILVFTALLLGERLQQLHRQHLRRERFEEQQARQWAIAHRHRPLPQLTPAEAP